MCGFLLYINRFGAVSMKMFLVGIKNCNLRQIMIMIASIFEKLSITFTLEKWHKSLFICDMLLMLTILITHHFLSSLGFLQPCTLQAWHFYFVNRNSDAILSYCERVLGRPRWCRSNSVGFKKFEPMISKKDWIEH